MKAVIFAGGYGTRLSEYTIKIPKPMVEIGGIPMLVHIMDHFASFGVKEFIIALGYKQEVIKNYFSNFTLINSDVKIHTGNNSTTILSHSKRDWEITLVDTGLRTSTGSRLKKLSQYIGSEQFFLTYGDGIASVDINLLLEHHRNFKKTCTITAVRPTAKFGELTISNSIVETFEEKPQLVKGWINGGYMVMEPSVLEYIPDVDCMLEREPMQNLISKNELIAFQHAGFWKCMDTKKDRDDLENIWMQNLAWPN